MTIEEKILNAINDIACYNPIDPQYKRARKAILALIKPTSGTLQADEVTLAFFRKYLGMPNGTLEDLCQEIIRLKKIKPMSREKLIKIMEEYDNTNGVIVSKEDFMEVAETILAEWKKGLK